MSEDYAIILSAPAFVRGKLEPIGSVFHPDKTIGRKEGQDLIEEGKAKRVKVQEPTLLGGNVDEEA